MLPYFVLLSCNYNLQDAILTQLMGEQCEWPFVAQTLCRDEGDCRRRWKAIAPSEYWAEKHIQAEPQHEVINERTRLWTKEMVKPVCSLFSVICFDVLYLSFRINSCGMGFVSSVAITSESQGASHTKR